MARDRFTAPNFHSQVHEVTNSAAWSNCIGHWEEGGSSDLVEASQLAPEVMRARLGRIEKRSDALQLPRLRGDILRFLYITQLPIKHILKTEVRNLVHITTDAL